MRPQQYHIVQYQVFEVGFSSRSHAVDLQNRISRLAQERLGKVMEDIFDRQAGQDELIKIDSLLLDIGVIPYEQFEEHLLERFAQMLEEALREYAGTDPLAHRAPQLLLPSSDSGSTDTAWQSPMMRSHFELLEYFLLHGTLPWWATDDVLRNPIRVLDTLIKEAPDILRSMMMRLGQSPAVRRRTVYQFPETTIPGLIRILEPGEAQFILDYHTSLDKIQHEHKVVQSEQQAFKQTSWLLILSVLLVDKSSQFNRKQFVRNTLTGMANYFNVQYGQLLELFAAALPADDPIFRHVNTLPAILRELAQEIPTKQDRLTLSLDEPGQSGGEMSENETEGETAYGDEHQPTAREEALEEWKTQPERDIEGAPETVYELEVKDTLEGKSPSEEEELQRETPASRIDREWQENMELLQYYLLHGSLPWSSASMPQTELTKLLLQALSLRPTPSIQLLRSLSDRPLVTMRLSIGLDEEATGELIGLLEPSGAEDIIHYLKSVEAIHRQKPVVRTGQKVFSQKVKEIALQFLLSERGSVYNTKTFLSSNIRSMADAYQLNYGELLNFLLQGWEDMGIPGEGQRTSFLYLLKELRDEEQKKASKPQTVEDIRRDMRQDMRRQLEKKEGQEQLAENEAQRMVQLQDILRYWLYYGELPWWGYGPEPALSILSPEGMWKELLDHSPQRLIPLLSIAGNSTSMQDRAISLLSPTLLLPAFHLLPDGPHAIQYFEAIIRLTSNGSPFRIRDDAGRQTRLLLALWEAYKHGAYHHLHTEYLVRHIIRQLAGSTGVYFGEIANALMKAAIRDSLYTYPNELIATLKMIMKEGKMAEDKITSDEEWETREQTESTKVTRTALPAQEEGSSPQEESSSQRKNNLLQQKDGLPQSKELLQGKELPQSKELRQNEKELLQRKEEREIDHDKTQPGKDKPAREDIQSILDQQDIHDKPGHHEELSVREEQEAREKQKALDRLNKQQERQRMDQKSQRSYPDPGRNDRDSQAQDQQSGSKETDPRKEGMDHQREERGSRRESEDLRREGRASQKEGEPSRKKGEIPPSEYEIPPREDGNLRREDRNLREGRKTRREGREPWWENKGPRRRDQKDLPEGIPYNKNNEEEKVFTGKIYIRNAGLVLLHPFLHTYFKRLDLLGQTGFINEEAQIRATHLLQFLVDGTEDHPEQELALNKILCGIPLREPLPLGIQMTQKEKEISEGLLQAVRAQWEQMKNTTTEGLRNAFLQRQGALSETDDGWKLQVEQRGYDVLLQTLPWSIGMIKLSWMKKLIHTEWNA